VSSKKFSFLLFVKIDYFSPYLASEYIRDEKEICRHFFLTRNITFSRKDMGRIRFLEFDGGHLGFRQYSNMFRVTEKMKT